MRIAKSQLYLEDDEQHFKMVTVEQDSSFSVSKASIFDMRRPSEGKPLYSNITPNLTLVDDISPHSPLPQMYPLDPLDPLKSKPVVILPLKRTSGIPTHGYWYGL